MVKEFCTPQLSCFFPFQQLFLIVSARQKTHFFREPVLPRLIISGLIINTGTIFSCRRIKNDNNFVIIQLKNWKKCLTRFFCIFSDFKEDCLPT
ncbi:MAG: hypothetical protein KZQ63_04790, partial [Candidatus Thiodiazotropha sp. (ex Lucinoma aequizonata)]|nr:hypothetical protein [Candidatus Thiodiazotropha sp. (ex Lucinoma aequizonata)]MCU7911461.1 hypothetical protein [Candidatus Thiodiazotropha sp. (ex Lucinoma aequizonata)]